MPNQETHIIQFKKEPTFDEKLDNLFLEDPIALFRLIEYCYKPYAVKLEKKTLDLLKTKGFIEPDNVVSTAIRTEIMNRFDIAWF